MPPTRGQKRTDGEQGAGQPCASRWASVTVRGPGAGSRGRRFACHRPSPVVKVKSAARRGGRVAPVRVPVTACPRADCGSHGRRSPRRCRSAVGKVKSAARGAGCRAAVSVPLRVCHGPGSRRRPARSEVRVPARRQRGEERRGQESAWPGVRVPVTDCPGPESRAQVRPGRGSRAGASRRRHGCPDGRRGDPRTAPLPPENDRKTENNCATRCHSDNRSSPGKTINERRELRERS